MIAILRSAVQVGAARRRLLAPMPSVLRPLGRSSWTGLAPRPMPWAMSLPLGPRRDFELRRGERRPFGQVELELTREFLPYAVHQKRPLKAVLRLFRVRSILASFPQQRNRFIGTVHRQVMVRLKTDPELRSSIESLG
jgi:hypothetical protein